MNWLVGAPLSLPRAWPVDSCVPHPVQHIRAVTINRYDKSLQFMMFTLPSQDDLITDYTSVPNRE